VKEGLVHKEAQKFRIDGAVSFCENDDGMIFLHLETGRYTGIDTKNATILKTMLQSAGGSGTVTESLLVKQLLAERILCRCREASDFTSFGGIHEATRSIGGWRSSHPRPKTMDVVRLMIAIVVVGGLLKAGQLKVLVSLFRRSSRSCDHGPSAEVIDRVFVFTRLRPWFYTAYNKCLFDSLVLRMFLQLSGEPAQIVLGVATKPFRAHAWVQIGEYAVNDTAENVQSYLPLLSA
jgi:hypothetical protein